jgi:lysylphosphatidylglycerol synthetase-like protein (DUF2156 family)
MGNDVVVEENTNKQIQPALRTLLLPHLIRAGDHEMAYATLQRGMRYFIVEKSGYIAFKRIGKHCLVLSDPIAPPESQEQLTRLFLEEHKNVSFWQTHENYSRLLQQRFGFYVNQMGVTTELPLGTYDVVGSSKQPIRTAVTKAETEGVKIDETRMSAVTGIETLVDDYVSKRIVSTGELSFLARELVPADEPDVRVLMARKQNAVLGIGVYNPMYKDGKIIGYVSDILRTQSGAMKGLPYAINVEAWRRFSEERQVFARERARVGKHKSRDLPQLRALSLGICPCAHIHDDGTINNPLTTLILVAIYQFGNSFYNQKGLAEHKRAYQGNEAHVYMCSRRAMVLPEVLALYKACNINLIRQAIKAVHRRFFPRSNPKPDTVCR